MNWIEGATWIEVLEKGLDPPITEILEPAVKKILKKDIRRFNRVLDAGCGNGRFSKYAADLGVVVKAVDIDKECVEITKNRGIDARYGNITNLPFNSNIFDYFVCSMVLMNVKNFSKGLKEFYRVLERKGRGLIAITHPIMGVANYNQEHIIEIPFKGGKVRDIHRPLSTYVNSICGTGMSIVGIEEPITNIPGFPKNEYLLIKVKKQ
jgi:SAM-dependent methyltransferase